MRRLRFSPLLALGVLVAGCTALNYPLEPEIPDAASEEPPAAPVLLGTGFGIPEEDIPDLDDEKERTWYELTRLARMDSQRGDLDGADERLEQAAAQLAARPASSAQRRAVFGMRAWLALDFLELEQQKEADLLAESLFEEAEGEPEIGGPALIELTRRFAQIREQRAEEAELPESQLPLLRLALLASENDGPSQARLELAYEVSNAAMHDGDVALARRAIDRAVLDARIVDPLNTEQTASIKIYKTRIALAQGDLVTAEASATSANRLFEEIDAPTGHRAIAEATLARVLAERGQTERARAIAIGARARIDSEEGIAEHTIRTVLAELGRLERAAGDDEAALALFNRALDIPSVESEPDVELIEDLTRERAELDTHSAAPSVEAETEEP